MSLFALMDSEPYVSDCFQELLFKGNLYGSEGTRQTTPGTGGQTVVHHHQLLAIEEGA